MDTEPSGGVPKRNQVVDVVHGGGALLWRDHHRSPSTTVSERRVGGYGVPATQSELRSEALSLLGDQQLTTYRITRSTEYERTGVPDPDTSSPQRWTVDAS